MLRWKFPLDSLVNFRVKICKKSVINAASLLCTPWIFCTFKTFSSDDLKLIFFAILPCLICEAYMLDSLKKV